MPLPKTPAQDFPSQLSQFVWSEIAKSLSMAEESYDTVEVFVDEVETKKCLIEAKKQPCEGRTLVLRIIMN